MVTRFTAQVEVVRETYVKFWSFYRNWVQPVETREVQKLEIPKEVFKFKFFEVVSVEIPFEGRKLKIQSGNINWSPAYYCGGKVFTLEEIKKLKETSRYDEDYHHVSRLISDLEKSVSKKLLVFYLECTGGAFHHSRVLPQEGAYEILQKPKRTSIAVKLFLEDVKNSRCSFDRERLKEVVRAYAE